ncbi:unnamed protein product [Protopolystoma xenopodis]|uniref:Uncharacterized protein n=1 Tax=Protopolystoma xenopodis TaxID=117903 RepID=A0A448XCY0_9PLAT|nr:unnamed protein product [Protopolystoma xenopodis]
MRLMKLSVPRKSANWSLFESLHRLLKVLTGLALSPIMCSFNRRRKGRNPFTCGQRGCLRLRPVLTWSTRQFRANCHLATGSSFEPDFDEDRRSNGLPKGGPLPLNWSFGRG